VTRARALKEYLKPYDITYYYIRSPRFNIIPDTYHYFTYTGLCTRTQIYVYIMFIPMYNTYDIIYTRRFAFKRRFE